jgi:asparagine synthase (glutamine-hydrolysing)
LTAFLVHLHDAPDAVRGQTPGWAKGLQGLSSRGPAGTHELDLPGISFGVATRWLGARGRGRLQPIRADDDRIVVVFDGRLHDPVRLRRALGLGKDADSLSDAELVAAAYRRFSDRFLSYLHGEFALILHDTVARRTFAARDTLGARILYWGRTRTGILVSNDLPAMRATGLVDDRLDRLSIADFLLHGKLDFFDKARTPFRGVHAIEPATALVVSDSQQKLLRYGRFSDLLGHVPVPKPGEVAEAFRAIMREVVAERMDADSVLVPLSGGLDSTTIAAAAMHAFRSGSGRARPVARTALASPTDPEREFAQRAAAFIGIDHALDFLDYSQLLSAPEPKWYPVVEFFGVGSDGPARPAAANADIALFGTAGDSLLYPERTSWLALLFRHGISHALFARGALAAQQRTLPIGTGLRTPAAQRGPRIDFDRTTPHELPKWLQPALVRDLALAERWEASQRWRPPDELHPERPNAQLWLQWPNWFSGSRPVHSTQTPAEWSDPFLDFRVISFVFSIPVEPWMHKKYLSRAAGAGVLPEELLRRPKVPAGNYLAPRIKALDRRVLDGWEMAHDLDEFIDRAAIPPIDIDVEGRMEYLNLRPLMLQRWCQTLDDWRPWMH